MQNERPVFQLVVYLIIRGPTEYTVPPLLITAVAFQGPIVHLSATGKASEVTTEDNLSTRLHRISQSQQSSRRRMPLVIGEWHPPVVSFNLHGWYDLVWVDCILTCILIDYQASNYV